MLSIENYKFIYIFICFFIISSLLYYIKNNGKFIKSKIDGKLYNVQQRENLTDMQKSSDHLAKIVNKITTLVTHLKKTNPDDDRTQLLLQKYNPENIIEAPYEKGQTSYSINKGEKIMLCLRTRDNKNKLVDINTMMFVALHEIAHIATISIGHTDEFWNTFEWLLEEAINIGIYTKQEFSKNPVKYCGITITSSPLEKNS